MRFQLCYLRFYWPYGLYLNDLAMSDGSMTFNYLLNASAFIPIISTLEIKWI